MKQFTKAQTAKLKANWEAARAVIKTTSRTPDRWPVVKLFDPAGAATWLIAEADPDTDYAFGLCDLGMGLPEIGYISLDELRRFRGRFGLGIERDRHWRAEGPLSVYLAAAREAGHIVDLPPRMNLNAD